MLTHVANQYCSYIAALLGMPHWATHVARVHWLVRTPVCTAPSIYHAEAIRVYQNLSCFYAHMFMLTERMSG